MNAHEARLIAFQKKKNIVESQYASIKEQIRKACNKGEVTTTFYGKVHEEVQKFLVEEGYTVGEPRDAGRNDYDTEISW